MHRPNEDELVARLLNDLTPNSADFRCDSCGAELHGVLAATGDTTEASFAGTCPRCGTWQKARRRREATTTPDGEQVTVKTWTVSSPWGRWRRRLARVFQRGNGDPT